MTGEQAFALYSDPRPGSTIRVEEVYMKQCTEPFHLDAPPEAVRALPEKQAGSSTIGFHHWS